MKKEKNMVGTLPVTDLLTSFANIHQTPFTKRYDHTSPL